MTYALEQQVVELKSLSDALKAENEALLKDLDISKKSTCAVFLTLIHAIGLAEGIDTVNVLADLMHPDKNYDKTSPSDFSSELVSEIIQFEEDLIGYNDGDDKTMSLSDVILLIQSQQKIKH